MHTYLEFKKKFLETSNTLDEKYGNPLKQIFGECVNDWDDNEKIYGCLLLTVFGYEGKSEENGIKKTQIKIIQHFFYDKDSKKLIKDTSILKNNLSEFRDIRNLLWKIRINDKEGYFPIRSIKIDNNYLFGGHTSYDIGRALYDHKSDISDKDSLAYIIEKVIEVIEKYLASIQSLIGNGRSFIENYEEISSYGFLRKFRTIFLFDFYKNLYYSEIPVKLSPYIEDYRVENECMINGLKFDFYLLSRPNTITYLQMLGKDLTKTQLDTDNKYDDTKFMLYLEEALCRFNKDIEA